MNMFHLLKSFTSLLYYKSIFVRLLNHIKFMIFSWAPGSMHCLCSFVRAFVRSSVRHTWMNTPFWRFSAQMGSFRLQPPIFGIFAQNWVVSTKTPNFRDFALKGAFSTLTPKFRDFRPTWGIFDLNTPISEFLP